MDQPAWMAAAWAELGAREVAGAADAPQIVGYFQEAGHAGVTDDETPWCAAFVGAMLDRAGIAGTRSLLARSYLGWGERLNAPRPGCICVLSRGADPAAGHAGFFLGRSGTAIALLGGNQSDAVTVAAFDADRLLGFRWPASTGATAPAKTIVINNSFERALAHVLEMEGGYSDDPHDPGGPTNRGVTLETFAKWRGETIDAQSRARLIEDLKRIPDDTVAAIYRRRYWQAASCDALPAAIALMHFDAAVNHGVGGAIRLLQAAVTTGIDGDMGPLTISAVQRTAIGSVLARYAALRRERYRALPHFWRFGRGWLRRVEATAVLADAWVREENSKAAAAAAMTEGDDAMTTNPMANGESAQDAGKWWAQSKTVWGAIITALATVVPAFGPLIGVDLPADVIRDAGQQTVSTVQAIAGLVGTLLTIYGRLTAAGPLTRRALIVKV